MHPHLSRESQGPDKLELWLGCRGDEETDRVEAAIRHFEHGLRSSGRIRAPPPSFKLCHGRRGWGRADPGALVGDGAVRERGKFCYKTGV